MALFITQITILWLIAIIVSLSLIGIIMKAILVKSNRVVEIVQVNNLKDLQDVVGGYID